MYDDVLDDLRESYNRNAPARETYDIASWKVAERQHFLSLVQKEAKTHLLEIGAGPGRDGKFFQDNGLNVICTDLSPEMVALCRAKGLTAYTMDFLSLDFPPGSFDAIYALNCLLHVPTRDLNRVLETLRNLLKSGGLLYVGVYGGPASEGIWPEDTCSPKRFFAFRTDAQMQDIMAAFFEQVYFKTVELDGDTEHHFQSMILRRQ